MDTIIVGGGVAGLRCGLELSRLGKSFVILEASDRVGGRIATDEVNGFQLDRGFQVYLTAYPEANGVLDLNALKLGSFEPGALIFSGGKLHRLSDPWRRPQHLLATAMSPVGTIQDKLSIAKLRSYVRRGSVGDLYEHIELPTQQALERFGFSKKIITQFFRPFLGGIFLDENLATSSRMFEFVFRMFSNGDAALPAGGMQAIPLQIANELPTESIRLNSPVQNIEGQTVTLASGEQLRAPNIVLATANPEAVSLGAAHRRSSCGVTCVYFSADKPPLEEPILVLNGDGDGPINNLCVPSQLCRSYAPQGKSLVSATVLGVGYGESVVQQVREQLTRWFGDDASQYTHLKTYEIPFALPSQATLDPVVKPAKIRDGLFRCGDDCDTASINGAMAAGRRAAEAVVGRF